VSNIELGREQEVFRRVRQYNGRYVRVLEFDKRGIGSSDRFEQLPTLEERIADIKNGGAPAMEGEIAGWPGGAGCVLIVRPAAGCGIMVSVRPQVGRANVQRPGA